MEEGQIEHSAIVAQLGFFMVGLYIVYPFWNRSRDIKKEIQNLYVFFEAFTRDGSIEPVLAVNHTRVMLQQHFHYCRVTRFYGEN
ncbi:uncharacterized protein N7473_006307 [Penicillium subrubescens]|uniref:Uncharacterized protein n=1 Tax=Penicillium subrubescens TaxID=1316194 RepID=A0A1Q5UEF7_9EURO|nr:uncharacterized protein N7473_006307 [Penicillium subrubescens]KAJ5896908.1 hypothetical protein N7473_006307 [Penicillium subrubescens]OKP10860.1 hypothetical protein PENSUB_3680 [Penicillium subrubescens]